MIKVLIIESSNAIQDLLVNILNSDPQIVVIGIVDNIKKAQDFLKQNSIDIIIIGVDIPSQTDFEFASEIMKLYPIPIIIAGSNSDYVGLEELYGVNNIGAVVVLEKPLGYADPTFKSNALNLIQTIKTLSQVKVIRRFSKQKQSISGHNTINCVAIGASTGGPSVLQTILSGLPENFPSPVLVVQHISKGFLQSMVEWLSKSVTLPIHLANNGEALVPGNIYFAPDGYQMGIDNDGRIALKNDETQNCICPSVAHLFHSVAEVFGSNAVGILLTGMGKDGAKELKALKDKGAVTIVQNKETSVIYGMPGQAVKLGAATYVLSPNEIVRTLKKIVNEKVM